MEQYTNMSAIDSAKVQIEPFSRRVKGVNLEDLLAKGLIQELKKEMPNIVPGHIFFGFTNSDKVISITHDREQGKVIMGVLDLDGDDPETISVVAKIIERVALK